MRVKLVAAGIAVALVVGGAVELALPVVGEHVTRSDLEDYGSVEHLAITAHPAIRLLWSSADRVSLTMGRLDLDRMAASPGDLGDLAGIERIDARAREATSGTLRLQDVVLEKRGDRASVHASLTDATMDVAAGPLGVLEVRLSADARGRLSASTDPGLGLGRFALDVMADAGKIVARPRTVGSYDVAGWLPLADLVAPSISEELQIALLGGQPVDALDVHAHQTARGLSIDASGRFHRA